MSILKDLNELAAGGPMGVTSAGSVAGFRSPIGGMQNRSKKNDKKKSKKKMNKPMADMYSFKFVEGFNFKDFLKEAEDSDFSTDDVIAKLKDAAKSADDRGEDSAAFALEDENGQLVKVWVPEEQADDFQSALELSLIHI